MTKHTTKLLGSIAALLAVSCTAFDKKNSVRFVATETPHIYAVKAKGTILGIHKNRRGAGPMCGHLNDARTWVVIEDECGGDSYPGVTAYKISDGQLKESQELQRIEEEHFIEYSKGRGLPCPVFLGFDPSGYPLISSATGMHTLHE
jgi:hypothetical protein